MHNRQLKKTQWKKTQHNNHGQVESGQRKRNGRKKLAWYGSRANFIWILPSEFCICIIHNKLSGNEGDTKHVAGVLWLYYILYFIDIIVIIRLDWYGSDESGEKNSVNLIIMQEHAGHIECYLMRYEKSSQCAYFSIHIITRSVMCLRFLICLFDIWKQKCLLTSIV